MHTDSTNFWLWIGTDESSYVVTDTTDGSCWHAPDAGDQGQIKNEAGDCLQWDSKTGVNFMAACGSKSDTPQQWLNDPTGAGSEYFINIWAENNTAGGVTYLNQFEPLEDSVTDLAVEDAFGAVDPAEAWIHADCKSSC